MALLDCPGWCLLNLQEYRRDLLRDGYYRRYLGFGCPLSPQQRILPVEPFSNQARRLDLPILLKVPVVDLITVGTMVLRISVTCIYRITNWVTHYFSQKNNIAGFTPGIRLIGSCCNKAGVLAYVHLSKASCNQTTPLM